MLERLGKTKLKAWKNKDESVTVLVDGDYDGEYFSQFRWRVMKNGYVARCEREKLEDGRVIQHIIYLHREVMNPPKGMWVRHKNGNLLDNRSVNLELMTPSQSAVIRPQRAYEKDLNDPAVSKYRGVRKSYTVRDGKIYYAKKWTAMCKGERIGEYDTEEEAARAYDNVASMLWGEDANLNFPQPKRKKLLTFFKA